MLFRSCLLIVGAVAAAMAGCEGEPEAELTPASPSSIVDPADADSVLGVEPSTPPPQGEPESGGVQGDSASIEVRPVTPAELQQLVAENKGKAVLVDFWATWCVPCVKQYPHTVELSKKHAEDLVVYSVSMDETDADSVASVKEFLASHAGGNVRTLQSAEGGAEEAYTAFEITGGALPHYKVFGRDGQLVATFGGDVENPIEAEEIDAAVEQAVGG